MLEDAEKEGHTDIVSWQPHGRAFKVHKEAEFVEKIMPRYFSCKVLYTLLFDGKGTGVLVLCFSGNSPRNFEA